MGQRFLRALVCGFFAVCAVGWLFASGERLSKATTATLGGTERYLAFASLDKPIYRTGETLYSRVVVLNAMDNSPIKNSGVSGIVEIKGPKGDIVATGMANGEDSVVGFSWLIPEGQSGGEYNLTISFPGYGFPPASRKFDIRAYRAPRLKSQIVFLRDGYGAGDKVTASLHSERAEGGVPEGANVTVSGRVDGAEVHTSQGKLDRLGNLTVSFDLPKTIERGDGTLSFAIEDGGIVETAAKTMPILLQTLDLKMFPEGGDLVEGVPCRVYVEARNLLQKPADVAGVIVDDKGKSVADFRTEHEGRGRFVFTPMPGGKYSLRVKEPASVKTEFPLPAAKSNGVVINSLQDFISRGKVAKLRLHGSVQMKGLITLSKIEKELDRQTISLKPGTPLDVSLKTGAACGVLMATVWDESGQPLAERLVYVEPDKSVNVTIEAKGKKHVPGGDVELTIKTTDDEKQPVGAVVGISITDETVLEMIDKREQAPRLPVMVLLESDVREMADAHVYLDKNNPKAAMAVDLLLGTQGWRRFALANLAKFIEEHGDAARRIVALKMESIDESTTLSAFKDGEVFEKNEVRGLEFEQVGAVVPPAPALNAAVRDGLEEKPDKQFVGPDLMQPIEKKRVADERDQLAQAMDLAGKRLDQNELFSDEDVRQKPMDKESARQDFQFLREYAHKTRPDRKPGERSDFAETIFWCAGVKTDPKTGEARIAFQLSDSVTSFKVMADAFSGNGALGIGDLNLESVEPFSIEPKIPLEVSSGDVIQLPIGVVNNHSQELTGVTIQPTTTALLAVAELKPIGVKAGERVREILPIRVGAGNADVELTLLARAGDFQDKVTRKVSVKPRGFPIEIAAGGLLGSKMAFSKTVAIPGNVLAGSLVTKAVVYPTPLANLTEAMERLLCEPCGCFEQTSSTNYPLVMAQQYFLSHTGVPQEIISRAKGLLDKGYNRLLGFECKKHGFEWFGEDPGHEALTAYGLLEFTDMAKVRDVDPKMLKRTRDWLLSRRDGQGSFKRERRALHTWVENRDTSNAYITWALLEAGEKGLDEEVSLVKTLAKKSKDSYLLALSANVLFKARDRKGAREVLERLVQKQAKDGAIEGAEVSITQSGGEALVIEATAFAILAWLEDPEFAGNVERGMMYLAESCKGGRFSSTQATVLALRAIVAYDKARAHPKAPGSIQLVIDGVPVGSPVTFDQTSKGVIKLPDFADKMTAGDHKVELKMVDGSDMPFSFTVNYYSDQPANASECKLALTSSLRNLKLAEGSVTEVVVQVTNKTKDVLPMPVAIIGIPGGLEPRHDQLKELVKKQTIDAYEVIGRDVVLYWRGLKPEQKVEFSISLVAAVPGTYEGPACRSYLYYTDEHKVWTPGLKAEITPRGM